MCLNLIDGMIVGESLNEFHTKKNQHYYFDDLPNKVDGHPPISIHLEWVKQNLKKYYVEEMDSICDNWEKKIPKKINDLLKNNDRGFIDFSVSNKNLDI
jgi:hypothetical protein